MGNGVLDAASSGQVAYQAKLEAFRLLIGLAEINGPLVERNFLSINQNLDFSPKKMATVHFWRRLSRLLHTILPSFLGSLTCLHYFHQESSISILSLKRVLYAWFLRWERARDVDQTLGHGYDGQRHSAEQKAQRTSVSGL